MVCPCCKDEMVVLELDQVEVDYCLACKGVWLDAGELELLLEGAQDKDAVLTSLEIAHNSTEEKRKCPVCNKKMNKIKCGKNKDVIIDKCPDNDGLWFDEGELIQIIKEGVFDKDNKILGILKNIFG